MKLRVKKEGHWWVVDRGDSWGLPLHRAFTWEEAYFWAYVRARLDALGIEAIELLEAA